MHQIQSQAQQFYQSVSQVPANLLTNTCLEILGQQEGVFIKQKFEVLEALTGWETPNVYKVFAADEQGKKIKGKKALFKCKEKSGTCARLCCPGPRRPFDMKVVNYGCKDFQAEYAKKFLKDESRTIFKMKREYQCTCLCFNRPKLDIKYTEGQQDIKLGYIINPFMCCNFACDVYDVNDTHKYRIEASCCQTYFWCACPCDSCNKVEFHIKNQRQEVVGYLMKKGQGCLKNMFGDSDNFKLVFPKEASKEDKALLMSAVLMMDYMYFEEKGGSSSQVNVA